MSERKVRPIFGALHRWVGLIIAGFLFFSGVTGAVISWDHELDEFLNPDLLDARAQGPGRPAVELTREIEARYPTMEVTYFPLVAEPGHSLDFWLEPRMNPETKRLHEHSFNQVFVDPASGAELGKREWGAVWPVTRENVVSFLYKLHFSLHLPEMGGTDRWGIWLLGGIVLLWTLDCFVGFYLTLPARRRAKQSTDPQAGGDDANDDDAMLASTASRSFWSRWVRSWKVRWSGGSYRVNFDLHRAAGLWAWGVLFTIAFTAFSLNLYREIFFPVMSLVSDVTPTPYDVRTTAPLHEPIASRLPFEEAIRLAEAEAQRRGWKEPAGSAFYSREYGFYQISFFRPEDGHGAGGVGHPRLFIDGQDGRLLGDVLPWRGTAADVFVQAQFPLHSGRILGLPGRILISLMGLIVAGLSVTGVYVWFRKRKSRTAQSERLAVSPSNAAGSRVTEQAS